MLESEWSEGEVVARCGEKRWCGVVFIAEFLPRPSMARRCRGGRRGAGSGWRCLGGRWKLGGAAGAVGWSGGRQRWRVSFGAVLCSPWRTASTGACTGGG